MGFTVEQLAAVEDRGGDLLVSAAAGSGKTRVLVERLFDYVVREHQNLDDFLIITYTRAAAAELRGRIAAELNRRLAEGEGDRHLQQQLYRIYRADIKTVDAFCTALIRENVHLIEGVEEFALTADLRVLEESEAEILNRRVMRQVLERFYARMDEGDALLADALGFGRDDRSLEELVLKLRGSLQSHAYPRRWMHKNIAFWQSLPAGIDETPYAPVLLSALRWKAEHWCAALERAVGEMAENPAVRKGYAAPFLQAADQFRRAGEAAGQGWEACRRAEVVFPRLGPVKDQDGGALKNRMKALWDQCRKEWKGQSALLSLSGEEAMKDIRAMAPAMAALLRLTEDFDLACQREKVRRNVVDFSDAEHYAITLLLDVSGEPTDLCRRVGARYREIMVDEYQDTNEVQNCIFEALSAERHNLFTVGDMKQSIYRFRLADPSIFLEKYQRFAPAAEAERGEGRKILLSRNFRSRREVLEGANFLFENLFSPEVGELAYGSEERLYPGAEYFVPRQDCAVEFHLIDVPQRKDRFAAGRPAVEARFVAERIASLLREGYPVQDGDTGALRPCRPGDFAVLMRSPSSRLRHYAEAFRAYGIPCATQESEDFFAQMEVAVTFSLLQIIDNPRQDVPLVSVLRSPVFAFSPDRLAEIRAGRSAGDFYDALAADEGEDSRAFLETLEELRSAAKDAMVHRLLFHIYNTLHLPGIFGAMSGGAARRENLVALYEYAQSFEGAGYRGLFAFVNHLRTLLERGEQPAAAAGEGGDSVQIMSIHRSKGLEFPVVVLADLSKDFHGVSDAKTVLVHPACGLGPKCVDLKRRIQYPTLARRAVESLLHREQRSEELRVLYVAMTRAKEKLILTASLQNAGTVLGRLSASAYCPVSPNAVMECRSMAEWVLLPLLCRREAVELRIAAGVEPERYVFTEDTPWVVGLHAAVPYQGRLGREGGTAVETARRPIPFDEALLDFQYPHAAAEKLPTKLTATQLKGRFLDQEIAEETLTPVRKPAFERPAFLRGERTLTPAERGTATHIVMQYIDFACTDVDAAVADMVSLGRLTQGEGEAVDRAAIRRFLASPLAAELRQAKNLRREYRFSLLIDGADYLGVEAAGEEVLLQGVVDCFFETPEGLVVVDFKTDRVYGEEQCQRTEEYRSQIMAYSAALARIFRRPVCRRVLYYFSTGTAVEV